MEHTPAEIAHAVAEGQRRQPEPPRLPFTSITYLQQMPFWDLVRLLFKFELALVPIFVAVWLAVTLIGSCLGQR